MVEQKNLMRLRYFVGNIVNEVYNLFQCKDWPNCTNEGHKKILVDTVRKIFTNRGAGASFDKGTDQARRNAKFSTNYVFNCIRLYLSLIHI